MDFNYLTPIVNPENPVEALAERKRLEEDIRKIEIFYAKFRDLHIKGSDYTEQDGLREMQRVRTEELISQRGFRHMTSEEIYEAIEREKARKLEILREKVERAWRERTD